MWPMTFQLPPGLPHEVAEPLRWSCLAGGPDNMPWLTELHLTRHQLTLTRSAEESGYLVAPWPVVGLGQLMGSSATLMLRSQPYNLLVELTRGKVNQVRCQSADWQTGGLQVPDDLVALIRNAAITFGKGVCAGDAVEDTVRLVGRAQNEAYQAAARLVECYVNQVFHIRHQRNDRLVLGCRLGLDVDDPGRGQRFCRAFNRAVLPLSWHIVEGNESNYHWAEFDRMLVWAEAHDLDVTAGPLVDFSSAQLPAWLWLWERDVPSMATFMCRFVEAAVRRYRNRIRRWQLTAASNWASVLSLSEDDLMRLTFKMGEVARNVDPSLDLVLGISQPWGEYMATADRMYSPFIFADHLIRSGLNLSGLNLEVVMGVKGRGSYCRDLLEMSRLLDLYALLGVPLQVTLGYPSTKKPDPDADPEMSVDAGWWRNGYDPATQADWAIKFGELALCKPYVHSVQWAHFSDREPHQFPGCGLIDRDGKPLPSLEALERLREEHID